MPEPNKKRLVELCRKHGVPIIEFDEYGHFCAERQQHPPVKVLDHEMVIYVCDFGKIFGSGLPLAFIESGQYTKMLLFLKAISGISVPLSLLQTLSGLLDAEYLAGHIEKCRERIDRTAKVFTELVRGAVPESVSIRRSQGSPFLWFELPGGEKSMYEFLNLALSRNVYIAPGRVFTTLPEFQRCFRVNCCTSKKPKQIAAGAKALGEVVAEFAGS
jgi:DNA-binding transcriptional MocR family regulator